VDASHHGQSRTSEQLTYNASPRAALALAAASKSRALIQGRPNASYEDVRALAKPVLRHRIVLNYNAKLDGATSGSIIDALLAEVPAHDRELPRTLGTIAS
jgi:MoxR-like ATPase